MYSTSSRMSVWAAVIVTLSNALSIPLSYCPSAVNNRSNIYEVKFKAQFRAPDPTQLNSTEKNWTTNSFPPVAEFWTFSELVDLSRVGRSELGLSRSLWAADHQAPAAAAASWVAGEVADQSRCWHLVLYSMSERRLCCLCSWRWSLLCCLLCIYNRSISC